MHRSTHSKWHRDMWRRRVRLISRSESSPGIVTVAEKDITWPQGAPHGPPKFSECFDSMKIDKDPARSSTHIGQQLHQVQMPDDNRPSAASSAEHAQHCANPRPGDHDIPV